MTSAGEWWIYAKLCDGLRPGRVKLPVNPVPDSDGARPAKPMISKA